MSTRNVSTGRLVSPLTPGQINAMKKVNLFKAKEGRRVRMWRLAGLWAIWSAGPEVGTWWLLPHDDEAREIFTEISTDPTAGMPVVLQVASGAIAVRTGDLGA